MTKQTRKQKYEVMLRKHEYANHINMFIEPNQIDVESIEKITESIIDASIFVFDLNMCCSVDDDQCLDDILSDLDRYIDDAIKQLGDEAENLMKIDELGYQII